MEPRKLRCYLSLAKYCSTLAFPAYSMPGKCSPPRLRRSLINQNTTIHHSAIRPETLLRDTRESGTPIILIHALGIWTVYYFPKMTRKPIEAIPQTRVLAQDLRSHSQVRDTPLTQSTAHLHQGPIIPTTKSSLFPRVNTTGSSLSILNRQSTSHSAQKRPTH